MGRKGLVGRCSFCGKTPDQVKRLVAGPGVFICDQCVALCSEIISQGPPAPPAPARRAGWIRSLKSGRWFGRLFHSEALQSG